MFQGQARKSRRSRSRCGPAARGPRITSLAVEAARNQSRWGVGERQTPKSPVAFDGSDEFRAGRRAELLARRWWSDRDHDRLRLRRGRSPLPQSPAAVRAAIAPTPAAGGVTSLSFATPPAPRLATASTADMVHRPPSVDTDVISDIVGPPAGQLVSRCLSGAGVDLAQEMHLAEIARQGLLFD